MEYQRLQGQLTREINARKYSATNWRPSQVVRWQAGGILAFDSTIG